MPVAHQVGSPRRTATCASPRRRAWSRPARHTREESPLRLLARLLQREMRKAHVRKETASVLLIRASVRPPCLPHKIAHHRVIQPTTQARTRVLRSREPKQGERSAMAASSGCCCTERLWAFLLLNRAYLGLLCGARRWKKWCHLRHTPAVIGPLSMMAAQRCGLHHFAPAFSLPRLTTTPLLGLPCHLLHCPRPSRPCAASTRRCCCSYISIHQSRDDCLAALGEQAAKLCYLDACTSCDCVSSLVISARTRSLQMLRIMSHHSLWL